MKKRDRHWKNAIRIEDYLFSSRYLLNFPHNTSIISSLGVIKEHKVEKTTIPRNESHQIPQISSIVQTPDHKQITRLLPVLPFRRIPERRIQRKSRCLSCPLIFGTSWVGANRSDVRPKKPANFNAGQCSLLPKNEP